MARRLGDPEGLIWTLNAQRLVLWGAAPAEEMISIAQEMRELSRRTDNSELLLDALLWLGNDYVEMGNRDAMLRVRQDYVAETERVQNPWHRYMALGADALEASVFGDLARAREVSQRCLILGQQVQDSLAETFHLLRAMMLDVQQGIGARAAGPFELVQVPAGVARDYRPFWALSWAQRGYLEAARAQLRHTLASQELLLDALRRPILSVMAQVAVQLDERDAARQLYELLLPEAGRHMLLQACIYLGPVDHYLGLLAHGLGEARAAQHYEQALRISMSPAITIQTQYEYGRLLSGRADAADRARARELLASAGETAHRFAAEPLALRAGAALSALTGS
jgi:hypothetical protein